jgi:hypothetical protein
MMTNSKPKDLAALTVKMHALLKDLTGEERSKVVIAVMTLFGESAHGGGAGSAGAGAGGNSGSGASRAKFTKSLATYLSEKQAQSNQTLRFLVTADWLRLRGVTPLTTKAVTEALRNNNQSRVGNAPDILNKNAAKGLVEKDGKTFFITAEGLASLGHPPE